MASGGPEMDCHDQNLTDHEYDGIREYDNPCPTWWHMIFLGTAVLGGLSLAGMATARTEDQIAELTRGVNRNSSPSSLRITDLRVA